MGRVKAYGTFVRRNDNIYRTSAYIQWGDSEKSIGACLLLNPGSAALDKDLLHELYAAGSATGRIQTEDSTMKQLISFVERIYSQADQLSGRLHIYNLFNLQNTKSKNAIDQFEELVRTGEYNIEESLVTLSELQSNPWLLLGWGINHKKKWCHLQTAKKKWLGLISESKVRIFGKRHENKNDYYHPCPRNSAQRPEILKDLVAVYNQRIKAVRFTVDATRPNILVDSKPAEIYEDYSRGWSRSPVNPESIVMRYSNLKIKKGYKLRAYQFTEGRNGNGIVWAIPTEKELPALSKCERFHDFFSLPKPSFVLSNFMEAVEGDKTPLSYLQASIVLHQLYEFGAMWHGISWGRDVILPLKEGLYETEYEWEMIEQNPEIIGPYFYYNSKGNPVIVFHTINDIRTVTLNRYIHTFNKDDYMVEVERKRIGTAGEGIIF